MLTFTLSQIIGFVFIVSLRSFYPRVAPRYMDWSLFFFFRAPFPTPSEAAIVLLPVEFGIRSIVSFHLSRSLICLGLYFSLVWMGKISEKWAGILDDD